MKCVVVTVLFLILFFGSSESSSAVFRFANIYGSHMVLQKAPQRAILWGFGEVGQEVLLTAADEVYRSLIIQGPNNTLNNTGIWSVVLVPQMFGGPYIINAYSVVNQMKVTLSLEDVLFGDVWICSGQSNMEFTVGMSDDREAAINESSNYNQIRLFTAEMETSNTPLSELSKVRQPWSVSSPKMVGGPQWKYFSAVCWYYAIQLYAKLKYPIGLVATTWGGTPIEAWSSPDALKHCTGPNLMPGELSNTGPGEYSILWNGMIYPFLNMTIYGVVWYQGEENAERPRLPYNCTFPAMIDDWRAKWYESTQKNTKEDFAFGFVQLSAMGNSTNSQQYNFAPLRWDQTARYGYVPNDVQKNVFMAVAMDLGNPNSTFGSGHPTDKKDVGARLALAGLSVAYDVALYYTGPLFSAMKQQKGTSNYVELEVVFKSFDKQIEVRSRDGFEILCQNTTLWIDAKISDYGPISVLIVPNCNASAVRYSWSDYPCVKKECAVYSGDLPAPPFIEYGPFNFEVLN